jgi:ABC-type glucose/galactose transport system permease subunit
MSRLTRVTKPSCYAEQTVEVNPYYQDIIRGGIILVAVGIDALSRRT